MKLAQVGFACVRVRVRVRVCVCVCVCVLQGAGTRGIVDYTTGLVICCLLWKFRPC